MAAVMNIPWYATVFRGDKLETALGEIAPVALRYGATEHLVLRAQDDTYKFQQLAWFGDKLAFDRYWLGPEFVQWRADYSSYYQVPVVYSPVVVIARDGLGDHSTAQRVAAG